MAGVRAHTALKESGAHKLEGPLEVTAAAWLATRRLPGHHVTVLDHRPSCGACLVVLVVVEDGRRPRLTRNTHRGARVKWLLLPDILVDRPG